VYFVASAFVVFKSTSGATNSVLSNKYVYLSAKRGRPKVVLELIGHTCN